MNADLSIINWLNCIWKVDLPYQSKLLAAYLRTYMNDHHDMAWPSVARIVKETGLPRSTAIKYLNELESKGWLVRDKQTRNSTTYIAVFPEYIQQQIANIGSPPAGLGVSTSGTRVVHQRDTNKQENKQGNIISESGDSDVGKPTPPSYQEIANLYNSIFPELPQCKELSNDRKSKMRGMIRSQLKTIEDWALYFNYVRTNCTWVLQPKDRGAQNSIDWFLRQKNYVAAKEGAYDDK